MPATLQPLLTYNPIREKALSLILFFFFFLPDSLVFLLNEHI